MNKMKRSLFSAFALAMVALVFMGAAAPKNQIEKIWYNAEKTSKIQIFLATDGKYYGKIIWLKEPNDPETGKARTDKENPEEKLQSTPLMGILILKGFSIDPEDKNVYIDGKVYDPKNGKTYCGKLTYKGNTIDLRGYICSASFLGRTSTWTLAEGQ